MNDYTLTDTAETIADNPEGIARQEAEDAAYAAYGQDLRDDCLALLHSVRRRLSGHEIAMCEAATGKRDDPLRVRIRDRASQESSQTLKLWQAIGSK